MWLQDFRALGMTLHPTFVPFSPWTTVESYLDLLRVICEEELTENVAPIQLGIRLLIPEGSRMLELEDIRRAIGPFDSQSLVYPWKHADPRVDALARNSAGNCCGRRSREVTRTAAFERIWEAAHRIAGVAVPPPFAEQWSPRSPVSQRAVVLLRRADQRSIGLHWKAEACGRHCDDIQRRLRLTANRGLTKWILHQNAAALHKQAGLPDAQF